MNALIREELGLLGEVAEMKRIYTAIENALKGSDSMCIAVSSASIHEGKTSI